MSDIVKRLRDESDANCNDLPYCIMCDEAADQLEKYRKALEEIVEAADWDGESCASPAEIAREALSDE